MSKLRKGAREAAKVRKIPNHDCSLPLDDDPANYRIYEGCCVNFRRRLWSLVTVSPSDPDSKKRLKSATQIHAEKVRHLMHFPRTIHPFSKGRFAWEMLMLPVWLLLYVIIPIQIASPKTESNFFQYLKVSLDMICWLDIILWFFTGYYDVEKQVVVLKLSKIAKRYILSYFIFDVCSSQPIRMYLKMFHYEEYYYVTAVLLLKASRLPTFIKYLHKFSERTGLFQSNIKFICFTTTMLILMFWTMSVIYRVVRILHPDRTLRRDITNIPLLMTAVRVTGLIMLVGVTDASNESNFLMLLKITLIASGFILGVIIIAKVMIVYQRISSSRNKYNDLLEQIGEYMTYKELPLRVRSKIMKYVDFKFQKHIFREEDVLNNLSSVLKHDILLQRCQRMIEKVDFFKDLPSEAMLRIVSKLRSEIYLSNDIIVLAGYAGNSMYFIYVGTVAVYTSTGKEICHLDDGDHFGEIALIINEPRVATVVAVKECELFRLSRKDFQDAIEPFPELNKKIRQKAMNRLETTLKMLSDEGMEGKNTQDNDGESEDDKSDIIDLDLI